MIRLNRKGQNTLEYVLLISAVVVGFLAVQHYLNRGLQGRVREASDNIGEQFDATATTADYTMTRSSTVRESTLPGGAGNVTRSEIVAAEVSSRTGEQTVDAPDW